MKPDGFALSLEAILSLLLLAGIASMASFEHQNNSLNELLLLQKENDLLKVWVKEKTFDLNGMKSDFEFVFPQKSGKIFLNGGEISIGKSIGKKAVSSNAVFFSKNLEKTVLRVIVFD